MGITVKAMIEFLGELKFYVGCDLVSVFFGENVVVINFDWIGEIVWHCSVVVGQDTAVTLETPLEDILKIINKEKAEGNFPQPKLED